MKIFSSLQLCTALAAAVCVAWPAFAHHVVPVSPFDRIELEGGGHVMVKRGDLQQVRLMEGSLAFTRLSVDDSRKLRIESCRQECPHHYDLEIEITTPHIDALAVSGGGVIESEGSFSPPHDLALAIEGGGKIDARTVSAEKVTAAVNGGGLIKLRAKGKLTAAVDGGGEIRYWGNPRVTQAIDGGGEVQRGD